MPPDRLNRRDGFSMIAHFYPGGYASSREVFLIAAVALLGLGLRLYGLGRESIWLDEATSIFLARMDIAGLIRWTAVDIHPPLYYILLHVWLAFGDGEAQVRLLSVIAGVVSIPVIYLLARRLFGVVVAAVASLLLAVSPLHVWYSQETRMYALLGLWGVLIAYFMLHALLDGSRAALIAYTICAILSLYTHYYTLFVLLFANTVAVYLFWRGGISTRLAKSWRLRKPESGQAIRAWLVAQTLIVLAFLPWLPVAINQVQSGGGAWVARAGVPDISALLATAVAFTLGPDLRWYAPWLRRFAYAAFGILFLAGVLSSLRRREATTGVVVCLAYLAVPLLTAWGISQVKPLYSLRYLLPFVAPYYILIAQGLNVTGMTLGTGLAARAVWSATLAVLLALGAIGVVGSATHEQAADWRGIAAYVVDQARPDDIVLFVPGWNAKPFDYYARGRVALEAATPIPVQAADIPHMIGKAAQGHQRLWLIQAVGHYADPQGAVMSYLDGSYTRIIRQRFRDDILVSLYTLNE